MHFLGSCVVLVHMRTPSPPLLLFCFLVVSDSLWPHGLQHTRLICPPLSFEVHMRTPSPPLLLFCFLVVSDSLWPHGLQHTRLICPPHIFHWCHPPISSSAASFFGLPPFSASGSFPVSHLFTSRGQRTGTSNSASILPMKIQDWFPLGWLDLRAVQGTLRSLLQLHNSKASIFWHSAFLMVQLSHPHVTTVKTIALTMQTFVSKVMSPLFNTLSMSWGDSTICYCRCFPHIPLLCWITAGCIRCVLSKQRICSWERRH